MTLISSMVLALSVLSSTAAASATETVADIQTKLVAAEKVIRSFRCTSTDWTLFGTGDQQRKSKTEATLEWDRQGGGFKYRQEMSSTPVEIPDGPSPDPKDTYRTTSVYDGMTLYNYMERPEDRFATRSSTVRVPSPLDAQRAFEYKYESQSNLKVLPSEKVNDRACYVIEGDQHDDKGNFQKKIVEWLDAESGIVMKRHMFDESGNLISEMRVTELKLNVNIDPQRFVFKAPPGVKIQ